MRGVSCSRRRYSMACPARKPTPNSTDSANQPRAAAARPTRAAPSASSTVRLEVSSASVMAAASGTASRSAGSGQATARARSTA